MSTPPPGWYDDGDGVRRWWDGAGWTTQTAPPAFAPPEQTTIDPGGRAEEKRVPRPRWPLVALIGGGAALVGAAVVALILLVPALGRPSAEPPAAVSSTERQLAIDAVDQYGESWATADCDSFHEVTTERFREPTGIADCSIFETQAERFTASSDDYRVDVTDVWRADDGSTVVATTETFNAIADDSGTPLAAPVEDVISYEYVIHAEGAQRKIDEIRIIEDGAVSSPPPTGEGITVPADALVPLIAFGQALADSDCAKFEEATAPSFRARWGIVDCESFAQTVAARDAVILSMNWTPVATQSTGRGTMIVEADTVLESLRDENWESVEDPVELDQIHRYHLSRSEGTWKIIDVHDVSGDRPEGQLLPEEESAAEETMRLWARAFEDGDCDAAEEATTADYREELGATDCAGFAAWVASAHRDCEAIDIHPEEMRYASRVDGYQGTIFVDVVTVCTQAIDEVGNPIEPPAEEGYPYRYHLARSADGWRIYDSSDGAASEDEPANANESAAIGAIRGYNEAWSTGDCALLISSSTAALRSAVGVADCTSFEAASRDFAASWRATGLVPTDTERIESDLMEIKVRESYEALTDGSGAPLDQPIPFAQYWVYTVELSNGEWVVSDVIPLR